MSAYAHVMSRRSQVPTLPNASPKGVMYRHVSPHLLTILRQKPPVS
jgi:hypothetical protein